jgi:hypothetical protein
MAIVRCIIGAVTAAANRSASLRSLVSHQAGLATRAQLRQVGVPAHVIGGHIEAGRWTALTRRVVALQTGPLSTEQVSWFAVLDGGNECVLDGLSALHEQGLQGFPTDRVQAAVPTTGRAGRHELYVRRRSRRLSAEVIHPVRQPPMVRVGPALVSALEQNDLPLRGCALLAAVVQQRMIRAADLRPLVTAATTLPHRSLYVAAAGDIEGGAHSLLEIDFHQLARRARIPTPRGQSVRTDARGRRRYLDADFGSFGVEVDGALHLRPLTWWDDMWRMNDVVIGGKPMLRFSSVGIRLDSGRVIEQLQRAAQRWR